MKGPPEKKTAPPHAEAGTRRAWTAPRKCHSEQRESIRWAYVSLSKLEFAEFMSGLLCEVEGVPTGREDARSLWIEYAQQEARKS